VLRYVPQLQAKPAPDAISSGVQNAASATAAGASEQTALAAEKYGNEMEWRVLQGDIGDASAVLVEAMLGERDAVVVHRHGDGSVPTIWAKSSTAWCSQRGRAPRYQPDVTVRADRCDHCHKIVRHVIGTFGVRRRPAR
jgi:hypothetical protein